MPQTIDTLQPEQIRQQMSRHILADGMDMVMDLQKSHGAYVHDQMRDAEFLDFFSCFATIPIGYNHPRLHDDMDFMRDLTEAALINPSNSDLYTPQYARFLETFERVGIPDYLPHAFFVAGGALAVENALKVAMDWKVQKNFQKGYTREVGTKVLHFRDAFHGRSGYTMSLTNTDPNKIKYFAKFEDWPRVLNPKLHFPLTEQSLHQTIQHEQLAFRQIRRAFTEHPDEICAIIIEPIQAEGGDNYFREEFFEQLRILCDEHEALLIYDEVQVGMCPTGKFWCHQHYGPQARPDLVAFGKKMQICGILAGPRVDEVEHNCFRVPSRINSTWGGNLVDMVRADKIMRIIEEDHILDHVTEVGQYLKSQLMELGDRYSGVTNVRGLGLICAFDLPTPELRNRFIHHGFEHKVLFLGCGTHTIRFRPTLTITRADIDRGVEVMDTVLKELGV